ncbi:MAG: DnaJ domain-containing protein [Candidatus Aminicenantes bacterium]|nr:MAG: DnaJ domain-containing protein [Candidatus Aminicenantes bacterium]
MEHIGLCLKKIYFKKNRGRLSFHYQNFQKYLFFQDGFLVYAKTNHPLELLGEVLFRLGKLSKQDYERIDEFIEPKKSIGSVLIENGLITKESLEEGLIYQMREIVLNMFSAFSAEFRFQDKAEFDEEGFHAKLKVPTLIEEGIRGMKHDPELETYLAKKIFAPKSIDFYLRLNEGERGLYELIKGEATSEEILASSNSSPEFFWKSLYLLYCLDLVDFKADKTKETPSPITKEGPEPEMVEEEKLAEVITFHDNLESFNYYQILDVAEDTSEEDVKKSYFRLARKFHPDLYSRELPPETIQKIDKVFDQITKAYQTLSDEKRKGEYDKQLSAPPGDEKKDLAKEAEKRFRQGKTLFDQGRYEEALVFLEQSIRLSQNRARYFMLLAMTQTKLSIYRKEAEKNFIKATKLEPWNAEAFVGLGILYRKEGLHIKAKKQFERALQIDPDHKIAIKELRGEGKTRGKTSFKDMNLKDLLKMDVFSKKKK